MRVSMVTLNRAKWLPTWIGLTLSVVGAGTFLGVCLAVSQIGWVRWVAFGLACIIFAALIRLTRTFEADR
jgi:hypothetical protein